MKLKATHRIVGFDGEEETVVIIHISPRGEGRYSEAVFVREDGTMGQDFIYHFIVTESLTELGDKSPGNECFGEDE